MRATTSPSPRSCGKRVGVRGFATRDILESKLMTTELHFDQVRLPPECDALRREVRAFLAEEIAAGTFDPHRAVPDDLHSPELSRKVGAKGWIGMTWPKKYGGHERSFLERYVVIEEMLAHRAPTRSYSTAD